MVNHFTKKDCSLICQKEKMRWRGGVGTNRFARLKGFSDALTTLLKAHMAHQGSRRLQSDVGHTALGAWGGGQGLTDVLCPYPAADHSPTLKEESPVYSVPPKITKEESVFPSRTILRHSEPNRTGALLRPEDRGEKVAVTLRLSLPAGGSGLPTLSTGSPAPQLRLAKPQLPLALCCFPLVTAQALWPCFRPWWSVLYFLTAQGPALSPSVPSRPKSTQISRSLAL